MQKRFKKSNLLRFLGHEATSEEVIHSHAYKKVARRHGPSLHARRSSSSDRQTVSSYRDSMVGSISQYHDKTPVQSKKPKTEKELPTHDHDIVGNRPKSGTNDPSKKDQAAMERRHHFIEPPKRSFNPYD